MKHIKKIVVRIIFRLEKPPMWLLTFPELPSDLFLYFCQMRLLEKRRIPLAILFQSVFLFFILFSAFNEVNKASHQYAHSKSLLCISPGNPVVVRETSEQLSTGLSLIKDNSILENVWLCAERIKLLELFTNPALQVPNRIFNTFYILTTIHAP